MQACHIFFLPGWPCATRGTRQVNLKALSKELMLPGTNVCSPVGPISAAQLCCAPSTLCTKHPHGEKADPWRCSLPPLPIHTPIFLETSSSAVVPPFWAVIARRKQGRDYGSLPENVFLRFLSLLQVGSFQPNPPLQKVAVETIGKKKMMMC